jgi:hypothetical protein
MTTLTIRLPEGTGFPSNDVGPAITRNRSAPRACRSTVPVQQEVG